MGALQSADVPLSLHGGILKTSSNNESHHLANAGLEFSAAERLSSEVLDLSFQVFGNDRWHVQQLRLYESYVLEIRVGFMNEASRGEVALLKLVAVTAQIDRITMDLNRDFEEGERLWAELESRQKELRKIGAEDLELNDKMKIEFTRLEWQGHFLRNAAVLELEYKTLYLDLKKNLGQNLLGAFSRSRFLARAEDSEKQLAVFIRDIREIFMGDFFDVADYEGMQVFRVNSLSMREDPQVFEGSLRLASQRLAAASIARGDHKLKGWKS